MDEVVSVGAVARRFFQDVGWPLIRVFVRVSRLQHAAARQGDEFIFWANPSLKFQLTEVVECNVRQRHVPRRVEEGVLRWEWNFRRSDICRIRIVGNLKTLNVVDAARDGVGNTRGRAVFARAEFEQGDEHAFGKQAPWGQVMWGDSARLVT